MKKCILYSLRVEHCSSRSYALWHAAYNSESRTFSKATCCVAMAMSSASAVIRDCESVPGTQGRCTLCKQPLRGTHSHPGRWKSELQQFLLKYSEIRGSSCVCKACARSIRRGLHGKYKGEFGLNKT